MLKVLENWKTRDENIKFEDFFGPVYIFDPSEFEFTPGDRLQIKQIAAYVHQKVSDTNTGAQYFDPNKSKNQSLKCVSHYFGHTSSSTATTTTAKIADKISCTQNAESKVKLFDNVVKVMKKKGIDMNDIGRFTDCMVSITNNSRNGIEGHIHCILCSNSGGKHAPISVQSKIGHQNKLYWVLSNFGRHLNTHIQKNSLQLPICDDDEKIAPLITQHQSAESTSTSYEAIDGINNEFEVENGLSDNEQQNINNITTGLSIETHTIADITTLESMIYDQISEQLIHMYNATITNGESQTEMKFFINNVQHQLCTTQIEADGSCLFGAAIHQILKTKVGSTTQANETQKLRANVVAYIKQNRSEFNQELKDAALHLWGANTNFDIESACNQYIEDELPKNHTWAGSEALKAITQMSHVNVLIVNESGDFYFPFYFNSQFKRTIILAYTTLHFEEHEVTEYDDNEGAQVAEVANIKRIHYDSVIHIKQNVVFALSKILAMNTYKKSIWNMDEIISINDTFDSDE